MVLHADESCAGQRIDRYLAGALGSMGLRGWQRAIKQGHVLINGRPAKAGWVLKGGEKLEVGDFYPTEDGLKGKYLGMTAGYLFFYKPAGLHSVSLAGSRENSLEHQLPELCREAAQGSQIELLQRLDYGTAGLLCAALDSDAAAQYRDAERKGSCRKSYLALLEGRMEGPVKTCKRLDVNGGKKVRIDCSDDKSCWTEFEPLWSGTLKDSVRVATIAKCSLCSGKRHQIRAHAAGIGYPLLGDRIYGGHGDENFVLSHYRIEFPGCTFQYLASDSPFIQLGCMLGSDGNVRCT